MATYEYDRNNTTRYNLKLNNRNDADIIKKLESVDSMQGYIKSLIRNSLEFRVKQEYVDQFGGAGIVKGADLDMLARGWEVSIGDVLEQLDLCIPRRISVDNGTTWYSAEDCGRAITEDNWDAITEMMDDDIREIVHAELAPCSEEEFLRRYLQIAEWDLIIG